MKNSLNRYAFSVGVVLALLTGCNGSQAPVLAPGALPQDIRPATSSFSVVYRFKGVPDGQLPIGRLIDVGGTLYGATNEGGDSGCQGSRGCGVIYATTTAGEERVLFAFNGDNGVNPETGLIDVKGTFYGTTFQGGSARNGTVYSTTPGGVETVVYSFTQPSDGTNPSAPLIDVKGTLYGTTLYGGTGCNGSGCGVVYSVSASGVEMVLHRFKGGSDGQGPSGLIYMNGKLYGTTNTGGGGSGCEIQYHTGCGTLYSLSLSGRHKVLYTFGGGSDGAYPQGLLSDVDGTLYGTTSPGDGGYGTVYSVTTSGAHKVLYRFVGAPDGASPVGGLTDMNGTLYGTTSGGGDTSCKGLIKGSPGCGTIYSITTGGTENVLYSFTGGLDGNTPLAPLIAVKGSLYGTTGYDGNDAPRKTQDNCCGTVFRFTP